jgi:hypothetical protein
VYFHGQIANLSRVFDHIRLLNLPGYRIRPLDMGPGKETKTDE